MILLALAEQAARSGEIVDHAQWSTLVRAHAPFLRRSIARLSGSGPHVDDIVQEAFVSAFRRQRDLPSDDGLLRGWLFRAARHHLSHHRRSLSRQQRKAAALAAVVVDVAEDERERAHKAQIVRQATLRLDEPLREVFVLVVLEGLTVVDAAAVLGVNENTLRSRLTRARAAFAVAVGAFGG